MIGAVVNVALVALLKIPAQTFEQGFNTTKVTGPYIWLTVAVYNCLIFSLVVKAKKIHKQIGSIFLLLLTFLLAFFGGCLLGLIPATIMTTKDVKTIEQNIETNE